MNARVAVIDVGSNSIKALVAERGTGPFGLNVVFEKTLEVRISQGIGCRPPRLHADRIEAGVEAVRNLWEYCTAHGPLQATQIVATSAVRSAENGHLFTRAVESFTGIAPRVLTGAEEADAIAMGVRTDPAVEDHLSDFTVFDLGGGSLEIIRFERHGVTARASLPLGVVRLTEQFIEDPTRKIPPREQENFAAHVRAQVIAADVSMRKPLVGCSGGLAALRGIIACRTGEAGPFIPAGIIRELAREIVSFDLGERMAIPGMPTRRADIFPAAMLVFEVVLELSGADCLLHSLHNLRYGLALRLLQGLADS